MLSKEKFVEIIKQLEEQEEIDKNFAKSVSDAFDCFAVMYNNGRHTSIIMTLLNDIFGEEHNSTYGSDIEYFVYELDYGRKYKHGMITNSDGSIIDLSTTEKLYDYLITKKEI